MMAISRQADLPLRLLRKLPVTRGDCIEGARPCPHLMCRYHLGSVPSGETCTLDMADRGGMSLEEIGEVMGLDSRETVRVIEAQAMRKILFAASDGKLDELLDHVDPNWRTADRSAGPSVRIRPPEVEPDADDEVDEAACTDGDEDTLAAHVWAAYLRASSYRETDNDALQEQSARALHECSSSARGDLAQGCERVQQGEQRQEAAGPSEEKEEPLNGG